MSASAVPRPDVDAPADPRRWRALLVLSLVQIMLVLDATVVNVALPPIQTDLGFTQAGLAWIVNGYALAFGGLLLLGGRLGDLYGRRRLFLLGVSVFAIASATAGLAANPAMLVGSRFAQGVGAALVSPAALSLITLLFTDPAERTRALSIWGGLAGLGGTVGVVLSGVLSDLADWRWVFLINLPVAAVALAVAPRLLPESIAPGRHRLDWLGAALVTGGVGLIVFALLDKQATQEWTSPTVLGRIAAGLALLAAFVVVESRVPSPLAPLAFFRSPTRSAANLVSVLTAAAFGGFFFALTLYMQQVLGYSALRTGFAYLPFGAALLVGVGLFSQLIPRIRVRLSMTGGMVIAASGLALFAQIPVEGSYVRDLLPAMLLFPLGSAAAFVGGTIAATSGLDEQDAGLGSGLLNASQQVGSALGLAVLVSLAVTRTGDLLGEGVAPFTAAVEGHRLTFAVAAGLMVVGAVLSAVGLRGLDLRAAARSADDDGAAVTPPADAVAPAG